MTQTHCGIVLLVIQYLTVSIIQGESVLVKNMNFVKNFATCISNESRSHHCDYLPRPILGKLLLILGEESFSKSSFHLRIAGA